MLQKQDDKWTQTKKKVLQNLTTQIRLEWFSSLLERKTDTAGLRAVAALSACNKSNWVLVVYSVVSVWTLVFFLGCHRRRQFWLLHWLSPLCLVWWAIWGFWVLNLSDGMKLCNFVTICNEVRFVRVGKKKIHKYKANTKLGYLEVPLCY